MKKLIEHSSHGSNGVNEELPPSKNSQGLSSTMSYSLAAPAQNPMVQQALERKLVDEAITNIFLIRAQRRSIIREEIQEDHRNRRTTMTNITQRASTSPHLSPRE